MGGGKSTSTTAPRLNGINIQSSVFGSAIPRGWGTFRVPANLLWYGDFQAIATTTKTKTGGKGGGGSNKSTTYSYKAALILGICAGPIAAIRTVYKDQSVFAGWSALSSAGLSLMAGYDGQATWGHLTTRHPDKAIGYSGIAYAYASAYALSDSAVVSNHSFEVQMPDLVAGSDDASPRLIVEQFLSEIPGWPSGVVSDLSDYGDYCLASGLLLSPVLTAQVQANEFLKDVLRATNSEAFMSEGKVKITPYGDTEVTGNGVTWTPDLTPIYDLDDTVFIPPSEGDDPLTFDLKRPADAFNIVQVEYLDRGHQYAVAMAPGVDQASIDQFGVRKADPARLHVICDSAVADKVADLLVRRTAGMRTTYSFRLPWNYVLLDPMDLVTVTDLAQGVDRVLVRVLEVNEADDEYEIVCEEMLVGQAAQALITRQPMAGYRPNWDAAPGDALAPALINPPRQLTDGALELWLATAGGPDWGGAEVWASIDGSTYERKGQVNSPARYGFTTSALPLHADPDSTNAVGVNIALSGGELSPATQEEADDLATLCLIGNEVIAYRDATLTGTGQYTLGYLRRGLMGTTPAAHASGTSFVRLDGAVESLPYRDDQIGLGLYVKLRSFNIHGRAYQELDEVDPYVVTLNPSAATYVPVEWNEIGDRPPVLTDLDPDGRLRPGNVGGLEPGETLYQSLSDILVDVDDLITTYGDTATAAASAAAAAAAASAASTAQNTAEDAAEIAELARDIANGAASGASASASIATDAADDAGGYASASAASASVAQGWATDAGTYASAADADRIAAETARASAQTASANAATSESNAAGAASAASSSATVSANARDAARNIVGSLAPSTFDQNGQFWRNGWIGAPFEAGASLDLSPDIYSFPTVAGIGKVLQVQWGLGTRQVSTEAAIPLVPNRRLKITMRWRQTAGSAVGTIRIYNTNLNASYTSATGYISNSDYSGPLGTWYLLSLEFDSNSLIAGGGAYLRPLVEVPAAGDQVYQIQFFRAEDITSTYEAGIAASASAASASQALASQNAAGSSASSASTQANNASTSASDALAYRDQSASSASSAAGSASAAQTSAVLNASVSLASLFFNPRFQNYPSATGYPPGWSAWLGPAPNRTTGEQPGQYGVRQVGGAAAYCGMSGYSATDYQSVTANQWLVVTARYRLVSGTLGGTGIYATVRNSGGAEIGSSDVYVDFKAMAGGDGVVGRTYSFSKMFRVGTNNPHYLHIYAMQHWDGFTGGSASMAGANSGDWFEASARPATEAEIQVGEASIGTTLSARITDVANVAASATSSVATRTSTLEAITAINPNRVFNPSGQDGLNGWESLSAYPVVAGNDLTWGAWFNARFDSAASYSATLRSKPFTAGYGGTWTMSAKGFLWGMTSGYAYLGVYGYTDEAGTTGETALCNFNMRDLGGSPGQMTIPVQTFTAASNIISFRVWLQVIGTDAASYGHVGVWQIKVELGSVATGFSDETTQGTGYARVTTAEGAISTLNGRNAAWLQQQVEAGSGAAAFVRLYAETSPGVQTSDVSIGAREIHLYNQTTTGFLKALSVVGGNAIFYGGLTAATFIRQGSGEGWPVALAQKDFVGGDGATFSWGLTFDNFPSYIAAMNNLAALTAGETYDIRLDVTKTGAAVIAKIITPGSPTDYGPITPAYAGGTSAPDYIVGVTSASRGESNDGTYDLNIYTEWNSSFYHSGPSGDIPVMEGYDDSGSVAVDIFALKSGVWTLVGTEYFSHYVSFAGGYVYSGWNPYDGSSYSETRTVQMGTGVQSIGVQYSSFSGGAGPSADGAGSLNSASWQAPGTSSTTRSATPGGQTTRFTVIPK